MSITAVSREQAIREFATQFGVSMDSYDGDKVWFVREEDKTTFQYMIADRAT